MRPLRSRHRHSVEPLCQRPFTSPHQRPPQAGNPTKGIEQLQSSKCMLVTALPPAKHRRGLCAPALITCCCLPASRLSRVRTAQMPAPRVTSDEVQAAIVHVCHHHVPRRGHAYAQPGPASQGLVHSQQMSQVWKKIYNLPRARPPTLLPLP